MCSGMEFINHDSWVMRYSTPFDDTQMLLDDVRIKMEIDNGALRNGTKGGSSKIPVDSVLERIPLSLISCFS